MKKPRKENERVPATALWALSWERLELPMRGDVWKQRWRSNFCVIILKLITCSEGKICYTNFSWHYPGYLEEYSFIRNLLDFRCESTDSALQIICNYIYFSRLFRLFSGYMKYKYEDIKTSCNFHIGKMKNYGISVCTHAIENMPNI